MHQHFRKLRKERSTILEGLADDDRSQERSAKATMKQLQEDKSLAWLAYKCCKHEAVQKAQEALEGQENRSRSSFPSSPCSPGARRKTITVTPQKKKASSSILSPPSSAAASSPLQRSKAKIAAQSSSTLPKVRREYVEAQIGPLFSWAVNRLRVDGVIIVHPVSFSSANSPSHPSNGEEEYELVTGSMLRSQVEAIFTRFQSRGYTPSVASIHASLAKDDMWRWVRGETVQEAWDLL